MSEQESKLAEKLENLTKFTEEEMNQVKQLREEYFKVQDEFGLLAVIKIRLNEQLDELEKQEHSLHEKFKKNQKTEDEFLKEITKKYGEGTLNPETGVFTKK